MSPLTLARFSTLAAVLLLPGAAGAQTANGSPTAPAPPGLVGTPRPVSRTAPSVGARRTGPGAQAAPAVTRPPPKLTAAERAEKLKLDHDLRICIGC